VSRNIQQLAHDRSEPSAQLNPTDNPVELTSGMRKVVGSPADTLDLAVINRDFNPHRDQLGDFTDPGQIYTGKCFIPLRALVRAALQEAGAPALGEPAIASLPEFSVYTSPAHQFAIDGPEKPPGNRVVLYGNGTLGIARQFRAVRPSWADTVAARRAWNNAHPDDPITKWSEIQHRRRGGRPDARGRFAWVSVRVGPAHRDIDAVVFEAGSEHMRLLKQMVHFDVGQGGPPGTIASEGNAGSTHVGGFSAGFTAGKPSSIRSDWPSSYGPLDDDNVHYNAHLIAVDYQAGTDDEVPTETLAAWKQNADMIDAFATIVPFASEDLDRLYIDYSFNPLEVHDAESAASVMDDLATLNPRRVLKRHGAFYCAEGQFSVASMGWLDACLLKKSRFGDTRAGMLIDEFQAAPGLKRDAEGRITNPEVGWRHLRDEGHLEVVVPGEWGTLYDALEMTNRTAVALEWIDESVQGAEAYRPTTESGMIAEPMSVAMMAWALLRTYMPREGLAEAMARDIMEAYSAGDEDRQRALSASLLGGAAPATPEGQRALAGLCMKAASGLLIQILSDDDFEKKLLKQAGFEEITNDTDKNKIKEIYKEFVGALRDPALTDQAKLDAALTEIDRRLRELEVERFDYDPRRRGDQDPDEPSTWRLRTRGTMQYAAPQCIGFWAQQPELFGSSGALRYVATAQHVKQGMRRP
jgi:hypothetical protein